MAEEDYGANARRAKLENFDPNNNGLQDQGIFGLPFTPGESNIVLMPVPWEVTVSFQEGTLKGAETILQASHQLDLYDDHCHEPWKVGIAMDEISEGWKDLSREFRAKAKYNIDYLEGRFEAPESVREEIYGEVKEVCEMLNTWIRDEASQWLQQNKLVGLIGGEHSVNFGLIQALLDKHQSLGILQIDAHADLRQAYEGFEYSHASIMYNVLQNDGVQKLVQVGLRDIAPTEADYIKAHPKRISNFSDAYLKDQIFNGKSWKELCDDIVDSLPDLVYISFDIDGLDPALCPNTGTPVPGGLSFEQVTFLVNYLAEKNKTIVGFDLCEVAPAKGTQNLQNDWDGNVGARVLYKLCCSAAKANGMT